MAKITITGHIIKDGKLFIDASSTVGHLEEFEIDKRSFENWIANSDGKFEWSIIKRSADTEMHGTSELSEYWSDSNEICEHLTEYVNGNPILHAQLTKWLAKYALLQAISYIPDEYQPLMKASAEYYASMVSKYDTSIIESIGGNVFKNNLVIVEQLKKTA